MNIFTCTHVDRFGRKRPLPKSDTRESDGGSLRLHQELSSEVLLRCRAPRMKPWTTQPWGWNGLLILWIYIAVKEGTKSEELQEVLTMTNHHMLRTILDYYSPHSYYTSCN